MAHGLVSQHPREDAAQDHGLVAGVGIDAVLGLLLDPVIEAVDLGEAVFGLRIVPIEGAAAPADDLVSYSFYNNGSDSDENGWNSAGEAISGDARSTTALPQFTVPAEVGVYRVRVKLDWCNIDPNGDQDGKFGDFMANGGQIVDFMLSVTEATGVDAVVEEQCVKGIFDMQGRKIEEITAPGVYIINGKKYLVK